MLALKRSLFLLATTGFCGLASANFVTNMLGFEEEDGDQSGGLSVAVLLKQSEVGACSQSSFNEKFYQHLNKAVEIGLQTELLAGPPVQDEDAMMTYPEHQFSEDIRDALHEVQGGSGLDWTGRQGHDTTNLNDEDDGRRLQSDDFCDILCAVTHQTFWCQCACGNDSCRRRRMVGGYTDEEQLEQKGGSLRGLEEATGDEHNSRDAVLARFKKRYHKALWEYRMGDEVAREFLTRKTGEENFECLAEPLEIVVILGRTMHD